MRKCALLIGINETPGLHNLSAAVSGATEMQAWAEDNGYDTTLLVDNNGPVTIAQVQDAISEFVSKECYDLLLIYFAGHGIQRMPGFEVWFLSGANRNSAEAVDLATSSGYSTVCGIPHVVFISDACRSRPTGAQMAILGANIFPIDRYFPRQGATIDKLYATMPGAMAWEMRRADNNNAGIYSEELLKALKGEIPEVLRRIDFEENDCTVVMSRELTNYLTAAIPEIIRLKGLRIEQIPWGEVTSNAPLHLARYDYAGEPIRTGLTDDRVDTTALKDRLYQMAEARGGEALRQGIDNQIESLQARGQEVNGQPYFGFRIVGARVISVLSNNRYYEYYQQDEATYISFFYPPYNNSKNVIIQLENGHAVPLMLLPDFVGHVMFDQGRLKNVSYVPSTGTRRREDYEQFRQQIERRKALIVVAADYGVFQGGEEAGSYLRRYKAYDPMLGLFAAYAYANVGNFEGVQSVYDYMRQENEPVLTDVRLLNSFITPLLKKDPYNISETFPLLTQGWSYIPEAGNNRMKHLAGMLIPGLWTTFTAKGFRFILKNYFRDE